METVFPSPQRVMTGRRERPNFFLQLIKEKNVTKPSKDILHHPLGGVSQDEISR